MEPDRLVTFCITLYNERAAELLRTLVSISRSLDAAPRSNQSVELHVIADGSDQVDSSILLWLGFNSSCDLPNGQDVVVVRWSVTRQTLEQKLTQFDERALTSVNTALNLDSIVSELHPAPGALARGELEIVFHLKKTNAGKLDSHRYFLNEICKPLQPLFIVQVDTGTVLTPQAFGELLSTMESDPGRGAVAAHLVVVPQVSGCWKSALLNLFQFNHFLDETTVRFPLPLLFGHQEVLPGACSMMRWRALIARGRDASGVVDRPPLDVYLAGGAHRGLLEANAYLAEDRLIAAEWLGRRDTVWRSCLAPRAIVVVDPCEHMSELMQQRRRWLNSTMSVRILAVQHALARMKARLVQDGPRPRIALTLIATNAATLGRMSLPAVSVLLIIFIASVIGEQLSLSSLAMISAIIVIVLWLAEILVAFGVLGQRCAERAALALIVINATVLAVGLGAAIAIGLYAMPASASCALAIFVATGLLSAGSVYLANENLLLPALVRMPFHLPFHLACTRFLQAYACAQFGNSSWGTKGLSKSTRNPLPSDYMLLSLVQCTFFIGNAALIIVGLSLPAEQLGELLLVIILGYAAMSLIGASFGLCYFSRHVPQAFPKSSGEARPLSRSTERQG